jgi:antibiotic biosynthesis monooxygenase (ABM) superfamily enzyme
MTHLSTEDTGSGVGTPLTTITTLVSRSGQERFAAQEFERTFGAGRNDTQHLSTLLIQQEGGVCFLISQFASRDALQRWRESARYQRMIASFEAHSLRELCTIEEPAVRIAVPSAASGPKWKTLVASWIVTFPLLLGLVRLLDLLVPRAPMPARIAVTSIIMSAAITWLISPFMLRVTRTWRLRNQQMKIVAVGGATDPAAAGPATPAGSAQSATARPIA